MKIQLKQFDDTLFMSVLCGLLKTIKAVQYVQNTIRCDIDFRRKCYIDCFLQKGFHEDVIDIYLVALQVLECNNSQKDSQGVKLDSESKDVLIVNTVYL